MSRSNSSFSEKIEILTRGLEQMFRLYQTVKSHALNRITSSNGRFILNLEDSGITNNLGRVLF